MIFVAIYVDDVLYFTNCNDMKLNLQYILTTHFKMKDLGIAECCVGLHITRDNNTIYLDQSKYIEEILEKFNMSDCKPVDTPADSNQRLTNDLPSNANFNKSAIPYQQAVGNLLYLIQGTRPDIAYAVNTVSRFNNNFGEMHWTAVKRIMRYLKGTISLKLAFKRSDNHQCIGFSDADWAADVDSRKSCTGYLFTRSGAAITWSSKRQPTVALSTAEAEYMALASATQEGMWLKQLEDELFSCSKPINIFCDNQSTISLVENNGYSARCKHIDIRHHYVREKLSEGKIILHYIKTDENPADAMTKALAKPKFVSCRKHFGLI